jgi:hypothetical protein
MAKKTKKPSQKMQAWIEARKRHHLSHAQVNMARELGMNPAKLGKIDNHEQEPWKLPLPQFIEEFYFKRFGKTAPTQFCLSRSDAASKRRRGSQDAPPGGWTSRQRAKLYYVDGEQIRCESPSAHYRRWPAQPEFGDRIDKKHAGLLTVFDRLRRKRNLALYTIMARSTG